MFITTDNENHYHCRNYAAAADDDDTNGARRDQATVQESKDKQAQFCSPSNTPRKLKGCCDLLVV
eukprot:scaffold59309_cov17-Prasinocladus_malaysianus.AAC.1